MQPIAQRRYDCINARLAELVKVKTEPVSEITFKECNYEKPYDFPKDTERFDGIWKAKKDSHIWFHFQINTPKASENQEVLLSVNTGLDGWDVSNPQFILYCNGEIKQGMDIHHTTACLEGGKKYDVWLYGYTGDVDKAIQLDVSIIVTDKRIHRLQRYISACGWMLACTEDKTKEFSELSKILENTVNMLDLRVPYSDEFFASVEKAYAYCKESVKTDEKRPTVWCVGSTHIDFAWLWTKAQTREKVLRSCSTAVELMEQNSQYKFHLSQPAEYKYVKEQSPVLYEKIKHYVENGQWNVEGGMYVEADCNLSGGESIVRQFIVGKKFFKEEFEKDNKVCWLPDVFGYSAAMPQIMKKCGIDLFITSKISWNEYNRMPHEIFKWKGIDGTELLTYFITTQEKKKGSDDYDYCTYVGHATPSEVEGTYYRLTDKDLSDSVLMPYGWGDGGGGTTQEMIDFVSIMTDGIGHSCKTKFSNISEFREELFKQTQGKKLPKWVGELYLEFHRGTYTSKKGDTVEIEYEERFGYGYNVSVKCGENDVAVDGNSFTMPSGNVSVTVTESAIKYAVTATNGVTFIEGVDDENKTSIEQTVKFSVTSERGYRVVGVKVNGNTVLAREGVYSIDVADYIIEGGTATSITVSVETEQIDYTLSTESSVTFKNGDQTVTSAHMGETIEVEYEVVFGYTYTVSVKCGEEDIVFADNKFVMPDGNVVVTLTKTANKYAVQAQDDFLTFTEGVVEAQTTVESVVKFTIKTTSTRGVENVKVNGTVIQAEQGVYAFNAADYLNENSQTISITYDFFNAIQAFSFKGLNATYSEVEVTVEGSDGEYAMLELRNASNRMTDRLYSKISNNTATFDLSGIENITEKFALAISASGNVASKITVRNNAEINRVNVQDMLKRTEGTIVENGLTLYSGPASVYTDGKMQSLRTRTFDLNMTYDGPDYKYFTVETSILQYCGSGGSNAIFYKIGDVNQHYVVANSVNYGDTTITDANKVVDLWTCREKILSKDTSLTVLAYVFCAGDHPQCATHGEAYSCIGNIIFYGDADLYLGSIRNDNENGLVYRNDSRYG